MKIAVLLVIYILPALFSGHRDSTPSSRVFAYARPVSAASVRLSKASNNARKAPVKKARPKILFDDFHYSTRHQLARSGWTLRSAPGWPGVPGAAWLKEGISLHADPERRGNRLLRLTSSTDGTAPNTRQSQICHQRKYLEGTYAARVRFSDAPITGPDGDALVQSFYTISPLKAPMDLDYSELDFEYLPNGGWGKRESTLYSTTWETFHPEPTWRSDNVSNSIVGISHAGWHILVVQVSNGKVNYFVDGKLVAEHGEKFYPESLMSINFNLWFIRDALIPARDVRVYHEEIDWVYFQAKVLAPRDVEAEVAAMRRRSIRFRDTVPAPVPALSSPCDL